MKLYWLFVILLSIPFQVALAGSNQGEVVGRVLGDPVLRSQISGKGRYTHSDLQNIFARPVFRAYYDEHKNEIEPTQREFDQFIEFYQERHEKEIEDKKGLLIQEIEQMESELNNEELTEENRKNIEYDLAARKRDLEGPGERFAMFVLPHWKAQVHLYRNFGGGRLLWQQRGIEAFDAMHTWLKTQEQNGLFEICDKGIRNAFTITGPRWTMGLSSLKTRSASVLSS